MAAPTSPVAICNLALSQLTVSPISSIEPPDEGSKPAAECAQWYDVGRREALRASTWGFARRRHTVLPSAPPLFGWAQRYELPNDYIRPVEVKFNDTELTDKDYEIEDGFLVCNELGTLQLVYVYDHNNPALWTPDFVTLCASNIAKWVGPALSSSEGNTRLAENRATQGVKDARGVNGQENPPRRVEYSRLLAKRRRLGGGAIQVR